MEGKMSKKINNGFGGTKLGKCWLVLYTLICEELSIVCEWATKDRKAHPFWERHSLFIDVKNIEYKMDLFNISFHKQLKNCGYFVETIETV